MRCLALLVLLLTAACAAPEAARPEASGSASADPEATVESSGPPTPVGSPANQPLDTVRVVFDGGTVTAEVADSHEERLLGLMHRPSLATDGGMLFDFPGPTSGGFWMKNTLIPLSIAYMSRGGDDGTELEVIRILDMEPCTTDTCPTYPPGQQYNAALEVDQGWFADHGVEQGDIARLQR